MRNTEKLAAVAAAFCGGIIGCYVTYYFINK